MGELLGGLGGKVVQTMRLKTELKESLIPGAGQGVFATEALPRGEFLVKGLRHIPNSKAIMS